MASVVVSDDTVLAGRSETVSVLDDVATLGELEFVLGDNDAPLVAARFRVFVD